MSQQIVWFKRDLRIVDHAALARAAEAGPVTCLYVFEPEYWRQATTSDRQWQFIRESLLGLDVELRGLGGRLEVYVGSVIEALTALFGHFGQMTLHSHEETGALWTFRRDKAVGAWCRSHKVVWHQYVQNGVCRPVSKRGRRFREHWEDWATRPLEVLPPSLHFRSATPLCTVDELPHHAKNDALPCLGRQQGGSKPGRALLKSFLAHRGAEYNLRMSAPQTAEVNCSRLSPYFAYGCLSLREVAHAVRAARQTANSPELKRQLGAFYTRLWWHCYALQVLENNADMEVRALVPTMDRSSPGVDPVRFDAWRYGLTGWPMVDACMRYLHQCGWLNFRMRAMLVTTATHILSLPWNVVAQWLGHLFVDFEPGIHYPQIQMHSGAAGSPILRIYNPVTQARELDPDGEFVRKWVPELRDVPTGWIFTPWLLPVELRERYGLTECRGYPNPLVDFEKAHRAARLDITRLRERHNIRAAPGFNERPGRSSAIRRGRAKDASLEDQENQLTLF